MIEKTQSSCSIRCLSGDFLYVDIREQRELRNADFGVIRIRGCSLKEKDRHQRCRVGAKHRIASPARTSGDPSAVAPPVPIPNTEVKRCSPDDSAAIGRAKVGRRQYQCPALWKQGAGLFFCVLDMGAYAPRVLAKGPSPSFFSGTSDSKDLPEPVYQRSAGIELTWRYRRSRRSALTRVISKIRAVAAKIRSAGSL
jgi:hypothetical protein